MGIIKFVSIKLGDKGTDVKKVCTLLKKHGSTIKPVSEFTIGVRSAVVCFQKKNGLEPTGIVDKKTWTKLNTEPKKPAAKKVVKK